MSSGKQVTLSKVILIIKGLISSLERIKATITCNLTTNLVNQFLASLCFRFGNPEENVLMGKCAYLHPRFKEKGFTHAATLLRVKEDLQNEIVDLINMQKEQALTTLIVDEPSTSGFSSTVSDNDDLIWQDFDRTIKSSTSSNSNPKVISITKVSSLSNISPLRTCVF